MSKRIAEGKHVINPIVSGEARPQRNPKVAGLETITGKTTLVPKITRVPVTKRKKMVKAIREASENKRGKRRFAREVTQSDVTYKDLYIDSQKKVEDLSEENYKQAMDLSYRCGQVDAYEYIIGNLKNVLGFSNTMRVTGADMNLSEVTAPDVPSLNASEPSRMKKKNS
ncbi:hypothetical protein HAX54_011075 [Datura stramonium]|uniref:Uncharacterized protein n=1 Tax=Datura stramonium TaxID=4076 RepID=A0ABS8WYC0_DATST|nr:hypothetical protein [Datura stramonium]